VHAVPLAVVASAKPAIAVINGAAVGAGLDIALAWDFRICREDAVLREAYIDVGLAAGDGGAWWVPRLVGLQRALDLLLTRRRISGAEAAEIGLVTDVVDAAGLEARTLELANVLAAKPPAPSSS
jgi:2-(1,2-epoxy-1,2-dihydrophenyl)acetyl-CoA isomerase